MDDLCTAAGQSGSVRLVISTSAAERRAGEPPRQHRRVDLDVDVTHTSRCGRACSVRTVNLSRGGALLSTREGFAIADTVEVTLRGNSRDWVVPGQVVRFEERATTTGRHLVAVEFETLLPRECLFHQIQGVPLGGLVETTSSWVSETYLGCLRETLILPVSTRSTTNFG